MRRNLLLIGSFLLVILVCAIQHHVIAQGFPAGGFLQEDPRVTEIRWANLLKDWRYGARRPGRSFGEFLVVQSEQTADSFHDVWMCYQGKVNSEAKFPTAENSSQGQGHRDAKNRERDFDTEIATSRRTDIQTAIFVKRTFKHTVSVYLSRGSFEDMTHITIVAEQKR